MWTGTPPVGACCVATAVCACSFVSRVGSVFRWRRVPDACSCCVSFAIWFLASDSWARRSSVDVGIAFATPAAAASTVALTADVAGLCTDSRAAPRFVLSAGRDSGRETGPTGSSVAVRCGVASASGDGDGSCARSSRWVAPLVCGGVAAALSAGRKLTLIFFS